MIGIDLGDKKHAICVLNRDGDIIDERTITNHRESLRRLSQKYPCARIACEVGSHSPWIKRFLSELGHEVCVANPRKLRAIYTKRLRQITGIGPITALSFVLTIEDPELFENPRDVGAYLGLVPRRDQSGGLDKQLRISKAGDAYLRSLLVGCAQYILGPFGPDSDLKRHGLMLAERGGGRGKRKAVVAIARKLAVLMLTLWKYGRDYEPLRGTEPAHAA